MSATGKKTKLEYLHRNIVDTGRGRTSTTWTVTKIFKGTLSAVIHYGSGTKDLMVAGKITIVYDFQLFVDVRCLPNIEEQDRIRDPKTGYQYEIQQALIPDNNKGKIWKIQLMRLR